MPSLAERIRQWMSIPGHGQEHLDIADRLHEQRLRLERLDAYVEARQGEERRRRKLMPRKLDDG